jgi:8-hydroxy-5-deazaflavin:NADPH oxidoreductase
MNIGIIGTGNMGRTLGSRWAGIGHRVLFGSRDVGKAKAAASATKGSSHAGTFDAAAAFGDVVLYTVRAVPPSSVLRDPNALDGKVLIDCNNSDILGLDIPNPDGAAGGIHFPSTVPSLAERLARDVPNAHVVKAFNTIPATVLALDIEQLRPHGVSVFLCSDDAHAKSVVSDLAEELGLIGVDSGGLERAQLVEAVADFIRFQIVEMNRGLFATMSMHVVPAVNPVVA